MLFNLVLGHLVCQKLEALCGSTWFALLWLSQHVPKLWGAAFTMKKKSCESSVLKLHERTLICIFDAKSLNNLRFWFAFLSAAKGDADVWTQMSVRTSVRLSVIPFWPLSWCPIITKLVGKVYLGKSNFRAYVSWLTDFRLNWCGG